MAKAEIAEAALHCAAGSLVKAKWAAGRRPSKKALVR
jgi:hypothetical protein